MASAFRSLFGTLIADGERLYDPRSYHDRLLLGLSGILSEANCTKSSSDCARANGIKPSAGNCGNHYRPG